MRVIKKRVSDERDALVRIVLPFKDQKLANSVRQQLSDLSRKIDADVHPVYTSQKIKEQSGEPIQRLFSVKNLFGEANIV